MGRMTKLMVDITLMQEFGWSWIDLQNTPPHVIKASIEKLRIDQKARELEAKRRDHG